MFTTTDYGSWVNHGDRSNVTVEATVADYLNGGDAEWIERVESSGAFERIVADYREAINDALPEGVTLAGNDFYGPAYPADHTWEGELDIAALIEDIDLAVIVERHDPDLREVAATPAEFRAVRESLGLSGDWLARFLDVNPRTVRSWEQGRDPVPGGVAVALRDLEDHTEAAVRSLAAQAERDGVIVTYRSDEDYRAARPEGVPPRPELPLPAAWHRAVALRVRRETGAQMRYTEGESGA